MSMAEALGISEDDFENAITKTKNTVSGSCEGCKYYNPDSENCCEDNIPFWSSFTENGCKHRKEKKNEIPFNNCEGCEFWQPFSEVCCNGDSPYRADFVNEGCKFKVCKGDFA